MKKILVVDDEVSILEALEFMLQDAGYDVETSSRGETLLKMEGGAYPDLILLDVLLSGEDGRVIAKRLKTSKKTRHIPIVMISAHPSAKDTIKEYLADDFLPKPFDIDDLLFMVRKYTE